MQAFLRRLGVQPQSDEGRKVFFVAYDQLSDAVGPLSRVPAQ